MYLGSLIDRTKIPTNNILYKTSFEKIWYQHGRKKFVCHINYIVNDKKYQPYSVPYENYIKNPEDTKKSYLVSSLNLDAITKENPSIEDLSVIVTLGIIIHTHEKSCTLTPLKCKPQLTLLNDIERVFNQKELTDVTLVVNGKDLYAHKVILAARSPVFLAMFKNNSIEKLQNRVEITDSNVDVIDEMLYFMYTGKTHEDETLVRGLLIAADKYDIPELKDICVQCLFDNINVTNALEILILADRHSCPELKKKTCEFIVMYKDNIINSAEYTELKNSHPNLMIDLFYNITATEKP
ncbi:protein maternal effect lethal 26-like [Copidosoma floridanum]|uniref:protein maternal effect lethal 26-like n=1 Tax=Copidosoma floridanum TaxID=29053 RepID=UPI0006C97063|nr:protein maternal effect lethal 26-like [Copidosoma floridanum]